MGNKNTKRGKWIQKIVLLAVMLGLMVSVASADFIEYYTEWEIYDRYNVSGYVNDTAGLAIEGAFVVSNVTGVSNTTNASGFYILQLMNNTHRITASKDTYINNSIIVTVEGSDLTDKNITLTKVKVAPEIVSWQNDKTEDNSTSFSINISEYVYFNVTANQTINTWSWFDNDVNINNNFDNVTLVWLTNGTKTLKVLGNNANGTTNIIKWTIEVGEVERGYYLGLFLTIIGLAVCFLFYGIIDINSWMYMNITSTFFGGVTFFLAGYMNFIGVYGSEQIHQNGEVGMLFVIIGVIAILYGIMQVFKLGMDEFGVGEKEEDRDENYEYT